MPDASTNTTGWGLIAGNGRFPFLVLEGARSLGIDMTVIALKEEASAELEKLAKRLHWVSLGELSKTIDLMHREGVKQAVMAGQVKHNKIFSSIRPDWKLAKLLFSLPRKNTDALIGAVARVLEEEASAWWIRPCSSSHWCLIPACSRGARPMSTKWPTLLMGWAWPDKSRAWTSDKPW